MREEIRMTEAAVNVARKERWPEVSVGFENRVYARENDVRSTEFMVGFSIPLGNSSKYRAAIRREEEKRRAVEFETRNMEQAVREEIHGLDCENFRHAPRSGAVSRSNHPPQRTSAGQRGRCLNPAGCCAMCWMRAACCSKEN
jgi:hypothetical protein